MPDPTPTLRPEELLVERCARCGGKHRVSFVPLEVPLPDSAGEEWTHVGVCPFLGERVLLRYQEEENDGD